MSARSKSFLEGMRKKSKLAVGVIIVAMVIFTFRVLQINIKNGKEYSEAVVLQENYESSTIPYERGEILDRNGNVLANSEKTYSLIIEPNNIRLKPEYQTATRAALLKFFDISETVLDEKLAITGEYGYYQNILQDLKYDQVRDFENYCKTKDGDNVVGVYFETKYKRNYPNGTLACHLLGYTVAGNVGQYGIEGYYNDELNGVDGKSYSYMSGNDGIASETVPAENGETVVSTIDMNIQKIIEDNISEYMQNTGAKQIGIIAMDPNNGEVLGMASSRVYDPNDASNLQALKDQIVPITQEVEVEGADEAADSLISVEKSSEQSTEGVYLDDSENKKKAEKDAEKKVESTTETTEKSTGEDGEASSEDGQTTEEKKNVKTEKVDYDFAAMTDQEFKDTIGSLTEDQKSEALNYLWQNYCISDVLEPGSTYKAFTIAGAMEDNVISDGDEFYCDGSQTPVEGESPVYCSYRAGHGTVDVKRALAVSCNDALMQIAEKEGAETFDKYQEIFNIGSKTGIDLQGETTGIKYSAKNLHPMELATSSFGQGVTTSMIQMAAGFCSVINGGNYYVPHVVKRLLDDDGNVVQDIEPVLVRKTISKEVSDYLRTYLQAVVEEGTGYAAGVEGYTIGGKTGTAEKLPRGNGNYVLSFIGFTPVEDPQIMLYVVVDEPNLEDQEGSGAGAKLFSQVMEDLLPYLNVYATNSDDVAYDGTEEALPATTETDAATEDVTDTESDTEADTEAASDDTSGDGSYTEDASGDGSYTDDVSDDTSGDGSYTDDASDDTSGDGSYTDDASGDGSYTDDTSGDGSYTEDASGDGSYTDDTSGDDSYTGDTSDEGIYTDDGESYSDGE